MISFDEVQTQAFALDERDRAALASGPLASLPPSTYDVSDDEVMRRDKELESGEVEAIDHAEFVRRISQQRGR